jgi:2-polyprenyl-6-hydroxyphenyl methylase/3-demethylubiquinone-9 3-methyltransferase
MLTPQIFRNRLRGFLQAYGTAHVKRSLWNLEFSEGRWNCLDISTGDPVYPFIEKYANRGSVLDLGCGTGTTGNELNAQMYRDYTGVDISDLALEKARRRSDEVSRTDRNSYSQSDITGYIPTRQFDVILFRDSIYYVPRARIKGTLDRYSQSLTGQGVFIVRMWSASGKYRPIVNTIERHFHVVEKHLSDEPQAAILVFRPHSEA